MKRQTVNLVVWGLGFGGIEITLPNYVRYLSGEFDFTVYSLRPKVKENVFNSFQGNGYRIVEGSRSTLETYRMFYRYAREHRDEVFHIFNGGAIVLWLARRAGVKNIIYHFHGTRYWTPGQKMEEVKSRITWAIALTGNLSNIQFIANSHYCKRRFHEQISRRPPVDVVYNGFDLSRFKFEKAPTNGIFKIVVVGRLIGYKNLLRLIRESKLLFRKIPNCKIYFVGSGSLQSKMEEEINRQGLQDRFVFTGFLSSYEQMYKDASAVVSVSYNESFGNTLVEAVLSGTPIFASDIPAHQEILEPLPESILKLEDDLGEQLAEKIEQIEYFRGKARSFQPAFAQKFSIETHIREFKNYYNR